MGQLDSDKLKMLGVNPDKMSELRHIGQEIKQFRPSQVWWGHLSASQGLLSTG